MGVAGNESTTKVRRVAVPLGVAGRGAMYDFAGQGAPVNGSSGTGNGFAEVGSTYLDATTGTGVWVNIGTETAPVWSPLEPVPYAITAANIIAMEATPVTLIAAPPTGYCLVVFSILLEMTTTSTAFTGGGAVSFVYHGGSVAAHSGTIPASVVTAAAGTSLTQLGSPTAANGTTVPTATGLDITNATAPFAAGTGTAKAFISYSVVKQ